MVAVVVIALSQVIGVAFAKNATDFTLRDSYGKMHNLYTHLNQGQYVLLYFAKKT